MRLCSSLPAPEIVSENSQRRKMLESTLIALLESPVVYGAVLVLFSVSSQSCDRDTTATAPKRDLRTSRELPSGVPTRRHRGVYSLYWL